MNKTQTTWVDSKRIMVETSYGDDFIVGFSSETNFKIEQQSVFKVSQVLGLLFDRFYIGDSNIILSSINRELIKSGFSSILFYQPYEKTQIEDERVRIGRRIKEIRITKGLDAKHLATITGIDAGNLCRIEAGKYSVGFDILNKIATVCNKKIDFIDIEDNTHECIITNCQK